MGRGRVTQGKLKQILCGELLAWRLLGGALMVRRRCGAGGSARLPGRQLWSPGRGRLCPGAFKFTRIFIGFPMGAGLISSFNFAFRADKIQASEFLPVRFVGSRFFGTQQSQGRDLPQAICSRTVFNSGGLSGSASLAFACVFLHLAINCWSF